MRPDARRRCRRVTRDVRRERSVSLIIEPVKRCCAQGAIAAAYCAVPCKDGGTRLAIPPCGRCYRQCEGAQQRPTLRAHFVGAARGVTSDNPSREDDMRRFLPLFALCVLGLVADSQAARADITYPWCAQYGRRGGRNCG